MRARYRSRFLEITGYGVLVAVVAALAVALLAQTVAFAQGPAPTDNEVNRIAKQLYCPVCESTPLDVCPTEACRQWRELIREMLADGRNEAEIKQYFVEHYGPQVLNEPPNRLASYLVPVVAFLLGAFLLFRGFRMWLKPSITEADPASAAPVRDPYIAKLEEELKKQK
ncbi:MAG TPA: cytochrome c-type biogenesis protein CcmH [Anaerolineales bacterium]|nr:cytochrome c-type biogenesis protein CcmH [Anaerolineales bacterium]